MLTLYSGLTSTLIFLFTFQSIRAKLIVRFIQNPNFLVYISVENGNLELVNCLLPVADVNAKTGNGSTALHLAALLSKANRIENDYEKKRLQMDFLSITRLLLRIPGIIIDCKNNIGVTPLYFAVDKGTEAVAKELLRRFLQYPSFLVYISTLVDGHGQVFLLFYLKKELKGFQKQTDLD